MIRPALENAGRSRDDQRDGAFDPFRPAADPVSFIAGRGARRARCRTRRVRWRGAGADAAESLLNAAPLGPTRVVPITPVPPAGVPWELLGEVVLPVPPAGPVSAPPGVICADAGSATRLATMAAASNVEARRRVILSIIVSESRSRTKSPCSDGLDSNTAASSRNDTASGSLAVRFALCPLAFVRIKIPFAQTDGARRDFDQFVVLDIRDCLLERHAAGRN